MVSGPRDGRNEEHVDSNVQSILWTITKVSELGIGIVDLLVRSEGELRAILCGENAEQIRKRCIGHGVAIERISFPSLREWIFGGFSQDYVEEQWNRIAALAKILGAKTIDLTSPPIGMVTGSKIYDSPRYDTDGPVNQLYLRTPWDHLWKTYVAAVRNYSEIAESHGLRLAVEPRPWELSNGTDSLLRLFDAVPSENLGGLVDVSHLYMVKEVPEVGIRKLGSKVFGVHLSDNDGITDLHWAPGNGRMNWPPVFEAFRDIGYDGELSLDISGIEIERELVEGKEFVEHLLSNMLLPRNA